MPYVRASSSTNVEIPRGQPLTLLLDYDGTLVPLAATPGLATPDIELIRLLTALATRPPLDLHVVSGRRRETLDVWFGHLAVSLWAEHGFWHRPAVGGVWEAAADVPLDALKAALTILKRFTRAVDGCFIEQKTASLAWHYRRADPMLVHGQARALLVVLEDTLQNTPFEVVLGNKLIEVRLRGINKAFVARRVIAERDRPAAVLAVGDDQTDEDLFQALPDSAVTVAVGAGPSSAKYLVDDYAAARDLIRTLVD